MNDRVGHKLRGQQRQGEHVVIIKLPSSPPRHVPSGGRDTYQDRGEDLEVRRESTARSFAAIRSTWTEGSSPTENLVNPADRRIGFGEQTVKPPSPRPDQNVTTAPHRDTNSREGTRHRAGR